MESKSRECSFYADEMNYERMESKLKEEEKRNKYTKDNIIIINIIPKKYEVLNGESD